MTEPSQLHPDAIVSLREITPEMISSVCSLSDTLVEPRKNFVATNERSLAQGQAHEKAWYRAVYANDTLVGFLMIVDDDEAGEYFLWRLMIAQPYHGLGFGRQAIDRLVEYVKGKGAKELLVSCGQGEGSPEGFYLKYGFKHNGQTHGSEIGLTLELE